MRHLLPGAAALMVLFGLLQACATYDPCTRDWFEYRADEIQRDFVRRNRGPVRRMQTLQSQLQDGFEGGVDVFAMLALASAKKDVRLLVDDFRSQVVPEARAIARTCELDQGYDIIVASFLTQSGVDRRVMEAVELFGAYQTSPDIIQAIEPVGSSRRAVPNDPMDGATDGVRGRPVY